MGFQEVLTIIIPHKNSLSKLVRLLNSIPLNSSLIKTIVVDDNSDIKLKASNVSADFPRVLFVDNMSNLHGAGQARNIGLKYVETEWVMFADADDFFLDNGIVSILKFIEENKYLDLFYYKSNSIIENSNISSDRHITYNKLIDNYLSDKTEAIRYTFHPPWGKVFKHKLIIEKTIDFEPIEASNDILFSIKLGYNAVHIGCLDQEIYCITRSEASLTSHLTSSRALSRISALTSYNNFILQNKISKEYLLHGFNYIVPSKPYVLNRYRIVVYLNYVKMLAKFFMKKISN